MTEVKYDIGRGKVIDAEYDENGIMKITRELFEALIEKQIPKEHHHTRIDHIVDDVRMSVCPSCLGVIPSHRTEYPNYCIRCGQKIDWGNENDRQIKNAIDVFENAKKGIVWYDMTEWYDLAIRSLKAWEEVLQKLEYFDVNEYLKDEVLRLGFEEGICYVMELINQKLEEIEE